MTRRSPRRAVLILSLSLLSLVVVLVAAGVANAQSTPTLTIAAPAGTSSYAAGSSVVTSWRSNIAVSSGQFGVWARSASGSWYVSQVVDAAGSSTFSTSYSASFPAASGYKSIVAWRASSSSNWATWATSPGSFTVTAVSATPTPTASTAPSQSTPTLTVAAPAGTSSYAAGSSVVTSWRSNIAVSSGQFGVWARSASGSWYVSQVVDAAGSSTFSTSYSASFPAASGYKSIVAWRASSSSNWATWATSPGSFTVTAVSATPTPTPTPTVSATPTPTPTPTPSAPAGTFNVKDYGAKGDNVTDDAPAIMRAVLAAKAAGGGTVYIPAGTYRLDQGYDLPGTGTTPENWHGVDQSIKVNVPLFSGVTVQGAGADATILRNVNSDSRNTMGAVFQNNVWCRGLTVTESFDLAAANKDGWKLMGCSNSGISDCKASNFYIGLNFSGCSNSTFTNVAIDNCKAPFSARTTTWAASGGGADYMAITNVTFDGCTASNANSGDMNNGFQCYKYNEPDSPDISNLVFRNCTAIGNEGAGFYLGSNVDNIDRVAFVNCRSLDNGSDAAYLVSCTSVYLTGNTTSGCGNGTTFPKHAGTYTTRTTL